MLMSLDLDAEPAFEVKSKAVIFFTNYTLELRATPHSDPCGHVPACSS